MALSWHPITLPGVLSIGEREIISAYGAGGKTSLLLKLAERIGESGGSVILTTTTKIYPPKGIPLIANPEPGETRRQLKQLLADYPVVCWGKALLPEGKLVGPEAALLQELFLENVGSHLLVEADGAAGRPIKGYAPYEPPIPPSTTLLLPVLGLDALGSRIDRQMVHRPELFCQQCSAEMSERINLEYFGRGLSFMLKRGAGAAPGARAIPVLNKFDLLGDELPLSEVGRALAEAVKEIKVTERIVFTSLQEPVEVKLVLQPPAFLPFVSCIVLAAGRGERMGRDKLLLSLGRKSVIEHAVDNALKARGVDELILVTRPRQKKAMLELFQGKKVRVVVNPRHREGMASSLQAGLAAVNPACQAALVALGDQPFVPPSVYNTLVSSYKRRWNLLTAPVYRGQRGNPVLVDRRIWPRLLEMRGDTGGRDLFSRVTAAEVVFLELEAKGIVQDIDTPDDYRTYSQFEHNSQD